MSEKNKFGKSYIGVKIIEARPMTRGDYNNQRGWTIPSDENPEDDGYIIKYPDGYISWCPKRQFEEAYRPTSGMPFGHAIEAARKGYKIARKGWNGKDMWVVYMSGMTLPPYNDQTTERKVNDRTAKLIGKDTPLETLPYFAMWTVNSEGRRAWLPGWLASQTDMLADDWMIVFGRKKHPAASRHPSWKEGNLRKVKDYEKNIDTDNYYGGCLLCAS